MKSIHSLTGLTFSSVATSGDVSALFLKPADARATLVLAHGAGAGMKHAFMQETAVRLADSGVATFRFQFPYMEQKKNRPDPPGILIATVRSAVACAHEIEPALPLFAGGKSLGGRMTSTAASKDALPHVRGIIFFGFPLHAPNKPSNERAAHLYQVAVPMLFLQGTRDALADLSLLTPVCRELGSRATLQIFEGADHSFHVLKSSMMTNDVILDELADATVEWISQRLPD